MKRKIVTFMVAIIFVTTIIMSNTYASQNRAQNFLNYKIDKVRFDVPYEIIKNEDGTTTYILYNYDGDIYEEKEIIKSPYEIIKLKEATSSIIRENIFLSKIDSATASNIETRDDNTYLENQNDIIATKSSISIDINYDKENSDIGILKIGEVCAEKYYPIMLRKKSILKIPKEIIKNMKKLDILALFNVARNDMKPTDMWKFRYIDDVLVNANGNHKIEAKDDRRTTCLQLKYQYKHENTLLMRFEYHQANDRSGYAYVDIDHVLDREEFADYMSEYDVDDINEYIDNLDYKFISDEWQVSYENGDVDFYLRKWVTYKINVYKDAFEKVIFNVGDIIHRLRFDDIGYVNYIR